MIVFIYYYLYLNKMKIHDIQMIEIEKKYKIKKLPRNIEDGVNVENRS